MKKTTGRCIKLEFSENPDVIYTARAGLVPINETIKSLGLYDKLDCIINQFRNKELTDYKGSQLFILFLLGILSGFSRVKNILESAEIPFLVKLVNILYSPVESTFTRFFDSFTEDSINQIKNLNYSLANLNSGIEGNYRVIVHDQSAIQKYGKKMEGVEKGYSGSLRKGSRMLQASFIIDAKDQTIYYAELKHGGTNSAKNASSELNYVLENLSHSSDEKILCLADSGYCSSEYMRTCDLHSADFIIGVKNDAWMKNEMNELNFQNFHKGKIFDEYGYREFAAERECWLQENEVENKKIIKKPRRIIVVKLPVTEKGPEYLFLATTLNKEITPEEIHSIYKKDRENIEQVNDELKNQLKVSDLSSKRLNSNRVKLQAFIMAWNIQRRIDYVASFSKNKNEELYPSEQHPSAEFDKNSPAYRHPLKRRNEWRTIFIHYISIGGRLKTGKNVLRVITSSCIKFKNWVNNIMEHVWEKIEEPKVLFS